MVSQARKRRNSRRVAAEKKMRLSAGSADITLNDIYAMFYVLVRQNKAQGKDNVMSFPLGVFKTLPKSPQLSFINKDGCLIVDIPEEDDPNAEKSDLYLPNKQLIKKGV